MSTNFDLEERTFLFARNIRSLAKKLRNYPLIEDDLRQLIKASGSVGANYIEANEALSKKDFIYRIGICLKEVKESGFFLRLIDHAVEDILKTEVRDLHDESVQLKKIFSKISKTSTNRQSN